MKVIEKYTGSKTYMYPNGEIANPSRVLQDFPACLDFVHIVETDENGEVLFAIQNLSAMRGFYNIDASLSEADAIAAIQAKVNTAPAESNGESTPQERIAAALELQNMLAMETVNTDDPDAE